MGPLGVKVKWGHGGGVEPWSNKISGLFGERELSFSPPCRIQRESDCPRLGRESSVETDKMTPWSWTSILQKRWEDTFLLFKSLLLLLLSRFSRVQLCATPETAAHQAPPSLGFSRQEPWSGLPFPSPMHESEKWKWSHSIVSDPQQPHELQPSRLLRPWDFPGKSTGVGCHCLLRFKPLSLCYFIMAIWAE